MLDSGKLSTGKLKTMKLSSNTRYAVRILFELQGATTPLSMSALADKTGITLRAIENIQALFKENGLTSGTIGPGGGLMLAVPLEQISLGRLVRLFDNGVELTVCCGEKSNECPNRSRCANRAAWDDISAIVQEQLDGVALDQVYQKYFLRG